MSNTTDHYASERLVVASSITNRLVADDVLLQLPDDAITLPDYRAIRDAIRTLRQRGAPVDVVAVWHELRRAGTAGQLDLETLYALAEHNAGAVIARHHGHRLHDAWALRMIDQRAAELRAAAASGKMLPDTLLAAAIGQFTAIADQLQGQRQEIVPVDAAVADYLASLKSGTAPGIATGFRDLDAYTGGWHNGDLNIMAARPRTGKTTWALDLVRNVASQNVNTFFASHEMGRSQLVQRMLAAESGVDAQRLRLRSLYADDVQPLGAAAKRLAELPIDIYDAASVTIQQLHARMAGWRARTTGAAFGVVDYLQLLRGSDRKANRVQEVGEVSRGLKAIARDLDMPLLVLAQLNRAVESRADHVPVLSDLRESGDIENDADMVLFLHRDELYDRDTDKRGIATVFIAKHRNGPEGVFSLRFVANTVTFKDLTWATPDNIRERN